MTGSFLQDFGGMYLNALLVTLRISAWGILIAFVIGFIASLIVAVIVTKATGGAEEKESAVYDLAMKEAEMDE